MTALQIFPHNWLELSQPERRQEILRIESLCKTMEQAETPATHHFCNGVYGREITLKAGTLAVGEIHKQAHINVVSKGAIRVLTEDGIKDLVAPCTFISPPGTKRVGCALEDTVWTVFLATELTDAEEIRKEFIADDYETLDKHLGDSQCRLSQQQ